METDVFILEHHAAGLLQRVGYIDRLFRVQSRGIESLPQEWLVAVDADRETVDGADVDTGVTLDAQRRNEVRFHVAVQAALNFRLRLLRGKALLHFRRHA